MQHSEELKSNDLTSSQDKLKNTFLKPRFTKHQGSSAILMLPLVWQEEMEKNRTQRTPPSCWKVEWFDASGTENLEKKSVTDSSVIKSRTLNDLKMLWNGEKLCPQSHELMLLTDTKPHPFNSLFKVVLNEYVWKCSDEHSSHCNNDTKPVTRSYA